MAKKQPTEIDFVYLKNTLEQLACKKSILTGLDEKIAALIAEPDNIEYEIFESEEIQDHIQETSWQISKFMQLSKFYFYREALLLATRIPTSR